MKSSLRRLSVVSLSFLTACLLLGWAGCAWRASSPAPESRTVEVQGRGTASAMPDKIEWRLLLHCDAPSVAAAHDRVLAADAALLARAKDLGIPPSDFKMQDLRQGANWRWVDGRREATDTYYSELSLTLSLSNVAKYPVAAEKLFVDNAVMVEGVEFKSSKSDDLRRQALAAAIANAKAQAGFVTKEFGVSLGSLRNANVQGQSQPVYHYSRLEAGAFQNRAQALPSLKPITVTATVSAVYGLR